MRYSAKNHKWAVIQSGYCVFGTGRTREAAINDSRQWMEIPARDPETGEELNYNLPNPSMRDVENELTPRHQVVDGDVYVSDDAEEIRNYIKNQ